MSRGFAHYEDYPIELWDVFTRYIGLGSRIDLLTPASVINRLLKTYWGDTYDVIPRSKEHAKDAATVNRSFLAWLSWQRTRNRPFFAFLNYNDAHSPYEVPDRSITGIRAAAHLLPGPPDPEELGDARQDARFDRSRADGNRRI